MWLWSSSFFSSKDFFWQTTLIISKNAVQYIPLSSQIYLILEPRIFRLKNERWHFFFNFLNWLTLLDLRVVYVIDKYLASSQRKEFILLRLIKINNSLEVARSFNYYDYDQLSCSFCCLNHFALTYTHTQSRYYFNLTFTASIILVTR